MPVAPFFYSDNLLRYNMGPSHPMKPARLKLTFELLKCYGLTDTVLDVIAPSLADAAEVSNIHSPHFLEALLAVQQGDRSISPYRFGLGTGDNPIFEGIYNASMLYTGASIQAASAVADGGARVAFNIAGGLHHAHYERAAGFCVLNDCALAISRLRRSYDRVAYVDIDVHHGDGVQELFYSDPSVLTLSIHERASGFFPGTGDVWEIGEGPGTGYSANIPVAPGATDEVWLNSWREAALPLLVAFNPDAIVLQMGADAHDLDPLAHISLTAQGWLEAIRDVKALNKPIVAIGGGGYNLTTTPRMWCLAIAELAGAHVPDEVPDTYSQRLAMPTLYDHSFVDIGEEELDIALTFSDAVVDDVKETLFRYHDI